MDGCIASPHWEACYTCRNHGQNGCEVEDIDLVLELGDFINCEQYEEK